MAIEILALMDNDLASRYEAFRSKQHEGVLDVDARLQARGWQSYLNDQ